MAASAMSSENTVKKIYQTVIDEVLTNIREAFLDEGYDEQLLHELKQMWESKLNASRAIQSATSNSSEDPTSSTSNPVTNRLPIIPATSSAKETNSSSNQNRTNNINSSQATSSSNASNANIDVKPSIQSLDPTRAALQALPHSIYNKNAHGSSSSNQQDLKNQIAAQLDGGVEGGSSSEDDEDDDIIGVESNHGDEDDADADDDKANNDDGEYGKEDPEPLNSEDDLTNSPGSNNSQSDLFDTEHVIVCQYDKITRIKNKWKFHLKDGIMNINGKDYLFSKANGDAEW